MIKITDKVAAPSRERFTAYMISRKFRQGTTRPREFDLIRDILMVRITVPDNDETAAVYDRWAEQAIISLATAFGKTTAEVYYEILGARL